MPEKTAEQIRQRRGTALHTLGVANHLGRGPGCPHAASS